MKAVFAVTLPSLIFSVHAMHAEQLGAPIDADSLRGTPGVEVESTGDGDARIITIRKGGVEIRQEIVNGEIQSFGIDNSGEGAVLCAWEMNISMSVAVDACYASKFAGVRQNLNSQISQINDFISKNNLTPISRAEVEAVEKVHAGKARAEWARYSRKQLREACSHYPLLPLVQQMSGMKQTDKQEALDRLLRTPRPPVMNPCL
ncbi:hypothetical protein CCGE525_15485 [Rhizobium jaguaris]|uniref:Uncharacterized protein n=2 Tax=Rhizobium jaguaris TaxID=1312183 RepID=A0A387FY48_9HYPH|nr:hypothetical protein CCGE525_15485 [Rhizobium jaguaris]